MISSDLAQAEAGGIPQPSGNWWLASWAGWLATIAAFLLGFIGMIGIVFNILTISPISAISSALQVVAACIILAIEGSSIVAILACAKPIGAIFQSKPLYVRTLVYVALTVFPMILQPNGMAVHLGFIVSAAITILYVILLIGKKGSLDDMTRAAANEQPTI